MIIWPTVLPTFHIIFLHWSISLNEKKWKLFLYMDLDSFSCIISYNHYLYYWFLTVIFFQFKISLWNLAFFFSLVRLFLLILWGCLLPFWVGDNRPLPCPESRFFLPHPLSKAVYIKKVFLFFLEWIYGYEWSLVLIYLMCLLWFCLLFRLIFTCRFAMLHWFISVFSCSCLHQVCWV